MSDNFLFYIHSAQQYNTWYFITKFSAIVQQMTKFSDLSVTILMAIFPGGPGLAGTWKSPFWISLKLRVMGDGGDNWSYKMVNAKLQSNRYHQQTNTRFLQVRWPSCHLTNSVKVLNDGEILWSTSEILITWLVTKNYFVFQLCPFLGRLSSYLADYSDCKAKFDVGHKADQL